MIFKFLVLSYESNLKSNTQRRKLYQKYIQITVKLNAKKAGIRSADLLKIVFNLSP
jgi:hypothetical protein